MVTKISILGEHKLVKTNPWTNPHSKFNKIVNEGLARPKKNWVLASPPPWYFDRRRLSPAQQRVNAEFKSVATGKGIPLADRIRRIRETLAGRKFK